MGSIPPNGAVAVTITVFDGSTNIVSQKVIDISCETVPQAEMIGSECVREVEEVKKKYDSRSSEW